MAEGLVRWDHPAGCASKGSILLVHGTAPMTLDGNIPNCPASYPLGRMSVYRDLATVLNCGGWSTLRYTRNGVGEDAVDWDEYMSVDHDVIVTQLVNLMRSMPTNKPRIVVCWSGGSLHVPHLPLEEARALVIIGGLCTNRFHNAAMMTKDRSAWEGLSAEIEAFEGMSRDEIVQANRPNGDGPLMRFWQESQLRDNWTYLRSCTRLPILILHGSDDAEVH
ncbi:MAG: hypothetical protein ACM3ZQ_10460, partial [Bacillota bacterium]